jgi:hypothetical protein
MAAKKKPARVQGEGDYDAARRYRSRTETFVASHDAEAIARKAAPKSPSEAREMRAAEQKGKARAKSGSRLVKGRKA